MTKPIDHVLTIFIGMDIWGVDPFGTQYVNMSDLDNCNWDYLEHEANQLLIELSCLKAEELPTTDELLAAFRAEVKSWGY